MDPSFHFPDYHDSPTLRKSDHVNTKPRPFLDQKIERKSGGSVLFVDAYVDEFSGSDSYPTTDDISDEYDYQSVSEDVIRYYDDDGKDSHVESKEELNGALTSLNLEDCAAEIEEETSDMAFNMAVGETGDMSSVEKSVIAEEWLLPTACRLHAYKGPHLSPLSHTILSWLRVKDGETLRIYKTGSQAYWDAVLAGLVHCFQDVRVRPDLNHHVLGMGCAWKRKSNRVYNVHRIRDLRDRIDEIERRLKPVPAPWTWYCKCRRHIKERERWHKSLTRVDENSREGIGRRFVIDGGLYMTSLYTRPRVIE